MMVKVVAVLILVQLIFSIWPVMVKLVLEEGFSPLLLQLWRDIFSSFILWVWVWFEDGRPDICKCLSTTARVPGKILSLERKEFWLFVLLGALSTMNSLGYILALEYVTPFNSALLHPSIPVFATVLGSLFGVETLSIRKMIGAILCISGSIAVVLSQSNMQVSHSLLGNMLLVLQSLAIAALLVGQKFVPHRHSPLKVTAIYYTIGTFLSIPICLGLLFNANDFKILTWKSTAVTVFGAIFVVSFNYAAIAWANKVSSPAIPANSMVLQPPLTYLLGHFIDGETISGYLEVGGGLVIVLGLLLTTLPTPRLGSRGFLISDEDDMISLIMNNEDVDKDTDLESNSEDGYQTQAEEDHLLLPAGHGGWVHNNNNHNINHSNNKGNYASTYTTAAKSADSPARTFGSFDSL